MSDYSDFLLNADKEREKQRLLWLMHQKREREHERLKRKKIEEYEKKRTELLELTRKERSLYRSQGKSEESYYGSPLRDLSRKLPVMSEKLNSLDGNRPFFKGPEKDPKINLITLREITVQIHRQIPVTATVTSEIRRDILNPEEIMLKRREGEGAKPIFDRAELREFEAESIKMEECRIIKARRSDLKRDSVSLSPQRHRSSSPDTYLNSQLLRSRNNMRRRKKSRRRSYSRERDHHKLESHHSRSSSSDKEHRVYYDYYRDKEYEEYRHKRREDKREASREQVFQRTSRVPSSSKELDYYDLEDDSARPNRIERRRTLRGQSHSRDWDVHELEPDYPRSGRSEKGYREYRERSEDRSYDPRDRRDSSRESRPPPAQYVNQVPFPSHYGGFMPRPRMVRPAMPPIRGPMFRGRFPTRSMRPPFYPPRFNGPQHMYRPALRPALPHFGRMY